MYKKYVIHAICLLNSTHIFFSGGYYNDEFLVRVETWIVDLENLALIPSTPMLTPREEHGCVLTEEGEVLIAGGEQGGDGSYVLSVHTFNPLSLSNGVKV